MVGVLPNSLAGSIRKGLRRDRAAITRHCRLCLMSGGRGAQVYEITLGRCWRGGFSFILIFNKVFLFGFFSFLSVTLSTGDCMRGQIKGSCVEQGATGKAGVMGWSWSGMIRRSTQYYIHLRIPRLLHVFYECDTLGFRSQINSESTIIVNFNLDVSNIWGFVSVCSAFFLH